MKYLGTITDPNDLTNKDYVDDSVGGVQTSLANHIDDTSNPHSVTKTQLGLGNVENKSSATIRGELTKANVTTALGYTPPTTNTTYTTGTATYSGTTKLYTSTGTNTDGTMTQNAINSALSGKANTSAIPTKTSQLTNDSGYITSSALPDLSTVIYGEDVVSTETTAPLNADTLEGHSASYFVAASSLATVATSGNYGDLSNKPNDNQLRAIYVGTSDPSSSLGSNGDIYIKYSS